MKERSDRERTIYCDGACTRNPGGAGGWAYIVAFGEIHERRQAGHVPAPTTNNRMEMLALIKALESIAPKLPVVIVSDSMYLVDGVNSWMPSWRRRGWVRRTRKGPAEIKNLDLWQRIDVGLAGRYFEARWVRGHNGHPQNELCDQMAESASRMVSDIPFDVGLDPTKPSA